MSAPKPLQSDQILLYSDKISIGLERSGKLHKLRFQVNGGIADDDSTISQLIGDAIQVRRVWEAEARGPAIQVCLMVDASPHCGVRLTSCHRCADSEAKSPLKGNHDCFENFHSLRRVRQESLSTRAGVIGPILQPAVREPVLKVDCVSSGVTVTRLIDDVPSHFSVRHRARLDAISDLADATLEELTVLHVKLLREAGLVVGVHTEATWHHDDFVVVCQNGVGAFCRNSVV